jgi:hypothetical protein
MVTQTAHVVAVGTIAVDMFFVVVVEYVEYQHHPMIVSSLPERVYG